MGKHLAVRVRNEGVDLARALDAQVKRRHWAHPPRQNPEAWQVELGARSVAKTAREQAREGDAHLQVELLTRVDCSRQGGVGLDEALQ